mmetsp:Transcript_173287/g.555798  ORF Transcript_173287/g.555798 Transcript_173287/m.555798 type:complete len:235 (+) Transcript_173287:665-1369(+)
MRPQRRLQRVAAPPRHASPGPRCGRRPGGPHAAPPWPARARRPGSAPPRERFATPCAWFSAQHPRAPAPRPVPEPSWSRSARGWHPPRLPAWPGCAPPRCRCACRGIRPSSWRSSRRNRQCPKASPSPKRSQCRQGPRLRRGWPEAAPAGPGPSRGTRCPRPLVSRGCQAPQTLRRGMPGGCRTLAAPPISETSAACAPLRPPPDAPAAPGPTHPRVVSAAPRIFQSASATPPR